MGRLPKFKDQLVLKQYPRLEKSTCKISEDNILELRTGKNHIIRILLECIKYIICETNIVFNKDSRNSSDENSDLITISNQDDSGNVAIYLKLFGNEFEHYFCDKKCVVGINIMDLYLVIKSAGKNDIIFIYMKKNNAGKLYVSTENSASKEKTQTAICTKDYEDEGIEIPVLDFDMTLSFPSAIFQKTCKDFHSFKVQTVKIEVVDQQISISSDDGDVSRSVIFNGDYDRGECASETDFTYCGSFLLPYFINFTKATPLCDKVSFFLKNDGFLMMQYKIANVGEICFILSPSVDE